ncbi:hypothetical protein HY991_03790 [Candidatus Micrarchaeota archaeon]|nr:hypothetical protein [Candidatus Micrarchaeota archaeon]
MTRVVLVEPEFEVNLGSVARAMNNFGFSELYLVRPKVRITLQARMFAKHAEKVLDDAKTVASVEEATKGFFVVGTTGVVRRYRKKLKTCVSLKEFVRRYPLEKVALLFGSESRGLDEKTVSKCDLIIHIPTCEAHGVLNISHAVAIVLYEIFHKKSIGRGLYKTAEKKELEQLEKMFSAITESVGGVRNARKVSLAFKKILCRSQPSKDEVQNLFAAFGSLTKSMKETKGKVG